MQESGSSKTHLADPYAPHGISRRAFLIRSGLTGAATLLGSVALASPRLAQAAPAVHTSLQPAPDGPWAASPVTLVYADSADVSHIDPALGVDFWSFTAARNMYEPLVEIDEASQ